MLAQPVAAPGLADKQESPLSLSLLLTLEQSPVAQPAPAGISGTEEFGFFWVHVGE